MNDKLKEIAVCDGWELKTIYPLSGEPQKRRWYHDEKSGASSSSIPEGDEAFDMSYLTDLNWLHPVAMKVLGELRNVYTLIGAYKHLVSISVACAQPPINGEYIDLFNAVYDAIVYLKNAKK